MMTMNRISVATCLGILALAGVYATLVAGPVTAAAVGVVVWVVAATLSLAAIVGLVLAAWLGLEKLRMIRATRLGVERDAAVLVVTAPADHQVFIRDSGPAVSWRPAHLDPRQNSTEGKSPALAERVSWGAWQSFHAGHPQQQVHPLLESPPTPAALPAPAMWPERVDLLDLLPAGAGSLGRIVLGLGMNESGIVPVTAPLPRLVHVGVGGSSGWGKSIFLEALAYQIATAPEAIELALVDLEAVTFAPFSACERLRYPIADNEADALAVIGDLSEEMEHRRELYLASGGNPPSDLEAYNHLAATLLPYIILLVDESTALLSNRNIQDKIKKLVLRARKYGVFAILGGQDWKADSLSTAVRDQFSTRVQFKANSSAQSRILLNNPAAAEIDKPGRAFVLLPGRPMIEMQAPMIDRATISRALANGSGPRRAAIPAPPRPTPTPNEARILEMHQQGASASAIARAVLGNDGGNQLREIRRVIKELG